MPRSSGIRTAFVIIATLIVTMGSAKAQTTYYWDTTTTGLWSTTGNWWTTASGPTTGGPPGLLDTAVFNGTGVNGSTTVQIGAATSMSGMVFNNSGTTLIQSSSSTSQVLSIGSGGITVNSGAGTVTLGTPVTNPMDLNLGGNQTWSVASGATLVLNVGNLVRSSAFGYVLNIASTGTITSTTLTNTNGILGGPWATYGSGTSMKYATINAGTIGGLTGTSAADAEAFTTATANYEFSTTGTTVLTASRTANTIRYSGTGNTIDLSITAVTQNLTLNGILATGTGTLSIQRTAGSGTVVVGSATDLVITGPQAVTISAPITGSTKGLTYGGTSTLTLSGLSTYTGATIIASGTLTLQNSTVATLTTILTSAISIGTGTTLNGAKTNAGFANRVFLTSQAISGSGTITINNPVNSAGTTDGGWLSIGSAASSTLSNFIGTVNIISGVFGRDNTNANSINMTGTVNVSANAVFSAGRGGASIIGALTGAGDVSTAWSGSNAGSITFGNGNASGIFSGRFRGSANATDGNIEGGVLSIVKIGTGTQTLNGSVVNTNTGSTTVNGGTLLIDFANRGATPTNLLTATSTLTLGGGTLSILGQNAAVATSQTLGNPNFTAGTSSNLILNSNGGTSTTLTLGNTWTVNAAASVLIDLSVANTAITSSPTLTSGLITAGVTVKDSTGTGFGTVIGGQVVRLNGTALTVSNSDGTTGAINFTTTPTDPDYSSGVLTLSASLHAMNSLQIASGAGGILDLNNNFLTLTSQGLLMTGSGNYTIQNGTVGQTGAVISINQSSSGTLTISGPVGGGAGGALTKSGTGTLILTGTNTYTGATNIGGNLQIGGSGSLNSGNYTGTIAIGTGGNFTHNSTVSQTLGGAISGAGSLTKSGAGTLIFSTTNTYTGGTTISSGTLQVGIGSTAGTIPGPIVNNATLFLNRSDAVVYSNVISGTGQVWLSNGNVSGSSTFTGASTYSGGLVLVNNASGTRLVINAAVSTVGSAGAITSSPFGTGTITIGQANTDKAGMWITTATSVTIANAITFNTSLGTDRFGFRIDTTGNTLSGVITANSDAVFSNNGSTGTTGTMSLTNQITGAGGLAIDLSQTSINNIGLNLTLNNATANANNYQGDTVIGRMNGTATQTTFTATLTLAQNDQIPNGAGKGNLILNNDTATRTGTLKLGGFSDTINGLSGSGTVDGVSGTPTLTVGDNDATSTFSGVIKNTAGTLAITKIGSGTLTLSGANTYAGTTTIAGGGIQIGAGSTTGALGTGNVTFTSPGNLTFNRSDTAYIYAGNITGPGSVTQAGTGMTTLTGVNNYSGATSITSGTLAVTGSGVLSGTSGVTINGSATKLVYASNVNTMPNITLIQGTFDGTGTFATSAVVVASNSGNVVTNGNGGTGFLKINALTFSGLGSITARVGGPTNSVFEVTTLSSSGLSIPLTAVKSSWAFTTYKLLTYGSYVGSGSVNDFTLVTPVANLTSRQSAALDTSVTGQVNLVITGDLPVWTGKDSTEWIVGPTGANSNWKVLPGGTPTDFIAGDIVLIDDTATTANGAVSQGVVTINTTSVSPTSTTFTNSAIDYSVSSTGSFGIAAGILTKNGTGTVTLNTVNTYTGATTINAGTLKAGVIGAFGTNSAIVFANTAGAALDLNGFNNGVGSLTGGGAAGGNVLLGSVTLTTGGDNTSPAPYAGTISGTGGITKTGTGTQTLGGANTYTGATTVNGGTLLAGVASVANVSGAFGNNSAITLANAANVILDITGFNTQIGSLTGGGTTGGNVTLGAATLSIGGDNTSPAAYAGVISGTGSITKIGTGTLILSGANTYTGATTISSGVLSLTNVVANNTTSGYTLNDANTGVNNVTLKSTAALTSNRTTTLGSIALRDVSPITVANLGTGTTTIDINSTTSAWVNTTAVLNKAVTLRSTGSGIRAGFIAFSGPGAGAGNDTIIYDATGNTSASTNWNVYVNTSNVAIANSYTGNVRFTGGVTTIQSQTYANATLTNLMIPDTASVTVDNGATLKFAWGSESFDALNGAGTVNNDTAGSIFTIGISNGSGTFSGVIANGSQTFTLTKAGTGTQVLSGASTYTGVTTISGGVLQIGNGSTTGSIAGTASVTNNSTLTFNRSDSLTFAKVISGNGTVNQSGGSASILTLNVANTYTGPTNVNSGTLLINSPGSLAGSTVTVFGGATLGGSGTIGGTVTVNGGVTPGTITAGTGTGVTTLNLSSTLGLADGARQKVTIFSNGANDASKVIVADNVTYGASTGATVTLDLSAVTPSGLSSAFPSGTTYTIMTSSGITGITYNGTPTIDYANSNMNGFDPTYFSLTPSSTNLVLNYSPTPEPVTVLGLAALGLGLGGYVRRRRLSH